MGTLINFADKYARAQVALRALLNGSATQAFAALSLDLGHASDTTLSRVSAGVVAVEGEIVMTATASQRIQITRDMTAAGGNVAYTGVGFRPRGLIAFAAIDSQTGYSYGVASDTTESGFAKFGGAAININTIGGSLIYVSTDALGLDNQNALVAAMDADGFTLTWSKGGTPTGTMTVDIVALK